MGKMVFNRHGQIVDECWKNIEALHENIELDYYVIMPNHIHGIIILNVVDANFASITKGNDGEISDRTKMELSKQSDSAI